MKNTKNIIYITCLIILFILVVILLILYINKKPRQYIHTCQPQSQPQTCQPQSQPQTCQPQSTQKYKDLETKYNEAIYGNKTPENASVEQVLWPYPKKETHGNNEIVYSGNKFNFIFTNDGYLIKKAAERFNKIIFGDHKDQDEIIDTPININVPVKGINLDLQMPEDTNFESYILLIDNGKISITAETEYGAIHGLITLQQLIKIKNGTEDSTSNWKTSDGKSRYSIPNCPWNIQDEPRFVYRGLLVDTARHYLPISLLKQIIIGMSLSKMNVFHWHIIDAQSFPLKLDSEPELSNKGAYRQNGIPQVYDKNDINDLIQFGKERAIRIIPEIEMPGHTASWAQAYPEIVNCVSKSTNLSKNGAQNLYNTEIWALEQPSGQLHPNKDKTYQVINNILKDVAKMFTSDYIHIGGDEPRPACWGTSDLDITRDGNWYINNTGLTTLFNKFYKNVTTTLNNLNRKYQIWEESVNDYNTSSIFTDKNKLLVNVWRGDGFMQKALKNGYNVIDTSVYWYLDCGVGNFIGTPSWCDPYKTWNAMYEHDPYEVWSIADDDNNTNPLKRPDDSTLWYAWPPKRTKKLANDPQINLSQIKGGQACLWGENADYSNYLNKVFPRLSCVAERLWSQQCTSGGSPTYVIDKDINDKTTVKKILNNDCKSVTNDDKVFILDMENAGKSEIYRVLDRLRIHSTHLSRIGIRNDPVQIKYCDSNSNECNNYCFQSGQYCYCDKEGNNNKNKYGINCPADKASGDSCTYACDFWGDKY